MILALTAKYSYIMKRVEENKVFPFLTLIYGIDALSSLSTMVIGLITLTISEPAKSKPHILRVLY